MEIHAFLNLDDTQISRIVKKKGPRVLVCPINGTRRWFQMEYPDQSEDGQFYLQTILARYLEIFKLFFSHGIQTVLTPVLGQDIVQRGDPYLHLVQQALEAITGSIEFTQFYQDWQTEVLFYGDYAPFFRKVGWADLLTQIQTLKEKTTSHTHRRLLWGMFANDAVEWVARYAVDYYDSHRITPDREAIITAYYGTLIEPVDLYLGSTPPTVFDMPMLNLGDEHYYFTVFPTPYLDRTALRRILYDYIFSRDLDESYERLTSSDWGRYRAYFKENAEAVLGVGLRTSSGIFWLPEKDLKR